MILMLLVLGLHIKHKDSKPRINKIFLQKKKKKHIVNMLVFVIIMQLCCCSTKATTKNT